MSGYHTIIVGGGTAGCVLAARLSETRERQVLLFEAGPDYPTVASLPPDIAEGRDGAGDAHDWGYTGLTRPGATATRLLRARIMGGCSAINSCWALRGHPSDYDSWRLDGWGFDEMLPFFKAAEADADFGGQPWHGADGLVPIRRYADEEMTPLGWALIGAAESLGHKRVDDHNRPGAVGAGKAPLSLHGNLRQSTAVTYLAAARSRPNLTIRPGTLVDRVETRNGRAVGVRLASGELIGADAVVLAAGAYASPAILLRSGIGPASDLRGLGVNVVCDLPGVGHNLQDHPRIVMERPGLPGMALLPKFPSVVTLHSSQAEPDGPPDLHLGAGGAWDHEAGTRFFVFTSLLKPLSRGRVRILSADPAGVPEVNLGMLTSPQDVARLREGVHQLFRLASTGPLGGLASAPPSALPPADEIDAWMEGRVGSYHHCVGTCRMGTRPDEGDVVSPKATVHGVEGLWVADASIMPDIPSANTNLPTIALAERIAAMLGNRIVSQSRSHTRNGPVSTNPIPRAMSRSEPDS